MRTTLNPFFLAAMFVITTLAVLFPRMACADLTVNGVDNASWSNTGTMTYTSAPTDPTVQSGGSGGQYELSGGGSLTVVSGSLTITNTSFGAFIGQQGTGSLTVNGGTFTWNANGSSEQRAVIGNSGNTGAIDITGGTFNFNVGTGSDGAAGLMFGREGGSAVVMITGTGMFVSQSEFFGMGGEYGGGWQNNGGGANLITLGSGNGVFELDGLGGTSTSFFNLNQSNSAFNFLSGSDGQISINGATQAFYNGLITNGEVHLNNAADTNTSDFAFVQSGGQGVLELATAAVTAPEPSTYALMLGGLGVLFFFVRRGQVKR